MIKIGFTASILLIVACGAIEALLMFAFDGLAQMNISSRAIMNIIMALATLIFLLAMTQIALSYKSGEMDFYSLAEVFPALVVAGFLTRIAHHIKSDWKIGIRVLFGDVTMILIVLLLSRLVYGSNLKISEDYKQIIILDDRIIYDGVIVVVTSEFAAIYKSDGTVSMFPKDRIRETRGRGNPEKSLFERLKKAFFLS
ncbi:hypothetical protein [Mesorhizobium sp. M1403]|uniref:hypothetical protein n=1 Tax=Mesorhizobium sp. M1403 TaxID=2957097 RepID=UPI003335179A